MTVAPARPAAAPPEAVTLLILAGGAATRAGCDKAAWPTPRGPLIAHPYRALRPLAVAALVAGPSSHGLPCPAVADPTCGQGPLAGLAQGLAQAPTPLVLVVACDMPTPSPDLALLLASRAAADPAADAVVPIRGGRLEPLFAVYRRRCAAPLAAALAAGERALHRALAELVVVPVPEAAWRRVDPQGSSFLNCNTRSELEALGSARAGAGG